MSRPLFHAAETARRVLEEYGIDEADRQCVAESETALPEILGRLANADAFDEKAIEALKAIREENRLRIERIEHRIERRREGMADALAHAGLPGLDCGTHTISLRTVAAGVLITDAAILPAQYGKQVITTATHIDKALIKEALQAGQDVPGATLTNARRSITVRRT